MERSEWRRYGGLEQCALLVVLGVSMSAGCQLFGGSGSPDPADVAVEDDSGRTDTQGSDTDSDPKDAGMDVSDTADGLDAETSGCRDGRAVAPETSARGRLVATPAAEGEIAVDGQLDEESLAGFEFDDPTGESDNDVSMHARWTSDYLYLGADVSDGRIETDSSVGPWQNDGLEIAFDPDASGGADLQGDERKWVVDAEGTTRISRVEGSTWSEASSSGTQTAARETDDGYVVELRIPWDDVGGLAEAKSAGQPGLIVVVNDRDGGETRRFSWTGAVDQLGVPDEWGVLALAEDPCGVDPAPEDAGMPDTTDGGETGDGQDDPAPRLGPPRYVKESDFDFQTTLNAVEDLGMDPTGQEPIDDQLDEARASNTLIEFPPGEYKIEAGPGRTPTHRWGGDAEHFGLKGLGEEPKDVQFVVAQQSAEYGGRWITDHGGEGLMLKNFAIQMTEDRYTSADIWIRKEDLALVEEVEWAGLIPNDNHGTNALLHFEITTQSGVGEINRLYIREGAIMPEYPDGMVGVRAAQAHVGTTYLTDIWLEQISSSAFRFTNVPGRFGVEGGYFKNNANTNLRGGAGEHPDGPSYIRDATVVIDVDDMNDYQPADEPLTTTQVLRVDSSGNGYSGMIIEDLDVYFRDPPPGSEVVVRPDFGTHGAFTLRDSRILNETSRPVTLVQDVSGPSDETARLENVHVTGSGSGALQADSATTAEIVDSCVESNFSIEGYDVVDNVDRSGCEAPDAPEGAPAAH